MDKNIDKNTDTGMNKRLNRLSTSMVWLCTLAMIVLPASALWVSLFSDNNYINYHSLPYLKNTDISLITPSQQFMAGLLATIGLLIVLYALFQLRRYFMAYKAGNYFSPQTTQHLHRFSTALLVMAVFLIVQNILLSVILTWHNPPGQRSLALTVGSRDLFLIIITGVMFCVSWSLQQAYSIQQENKGFV